MRILKDDWRYGLTTSPDNSNAGAEQQIGVGFSTVVMHTSFVQQSASGQLETTGTSERKWMKSTASRRRLVVSIQNVLDVNSKWTALLISSKMSFENELFCWMMDDTALDNESLVPLGSSIHPKVSVFCPDLTHLPDNER